MTLSFSAINLVLPLRRIPAVSTNTYSVPLRMTDSSTASRVVPATGETMERSEPAKAFSSVDLPTFGRPMMATLIFGSSPAFRRSFSRAHRKSGVTNSSKSSKPEVMLRGDREQVLEPQRVKLVSQILALGAVDLIHRQRHRLAQLAEHGGQLAIGAGDLGASVDQKNDVGSVLDRHARLLEDLGGDEIGIVGDDPAGIDQTRKGGPDIPLGRKCGLA